MINIVWGSTEKPASSQQLVDLLSGVDEIEGCLYIGYPIIGTADGSFPIDALLVSAHKGLILFSLIEGKDIHSYDRQQDEAYNKMRSKLLQHQELVSRRDLKVRLSTITFAPALSDLSQDALSDYPLCNKADLVGQILDLPNQDEDIYVPLLSVIQSISSLRRGRSKRDLKKEDSKGWKVRSLEETIANLDAQQGMAVVETFEGVQRIRGLAGSGKTIVLALKVAYLHAKHPDWRMAVTFNTRSLKKQFEGLITSFVLEQANCQPDWDRVRILNAWGAPGEEQRSGIYYEFCNDHGLQYYDFRGARERFGPSNEFSGACEFALNSLKTTIKQKYDVILVDEAQDFSPSFLLLCYELLKEPKRLVYAYDELQNLALKPLPPMEEIFGCKPDGSPRVQFSPEQPGKPKQDIVLDTCYRNSKPVLTTAHALGFGIYREKGLVQIFDNSRLWIEVGYRVASGQLEHGKNVVLERTSKSSPAFLEARSTADDLLQFEVFDDDKSQLEYLVRSILDNVRKEELLPEDIIVINPDPLTTKHAVGRIRQALLQNGINSHLVGITSSLDGFSVPGSVAFTGIYRAKGNEAAMVYIINSHDCYDASRPRDLALVRNRLFTAITRSKAWVRVFGIGPKMTKLKREFEKVREHEFRLSFQYPTVGQLNELTIVNRDMSHAERARLEQKESQLLSLIDSLESEQAYLQDFPEESIKKLRQLLDQRGK